MPWLLPLIASLLLFVLAPFFRKWVDLVLWPRLSDWWAARSRRTLERQIQRLTDELANMPTLVFMIVFCFRRVFIVLLLMTLTVYFVSPLSSDLRLLPLDVSKWPKPTGLLRVIMVNLVYLVLMVPAFVAWESYLKLRSMYTRFKNWDGYIASTKLRITDLEIKLKSTSGV